MGMSISFNAHNNLMELLLIAHLKNKNNEVPNYSACKEKCQSLNSGLYKSKAPYYSMLFFLSCMLLFGAN